MNLIGGGLPISARCKQQTSEFRTRIEFGKPKVNHLVVGRGECGLERSIVGGRQNPPHVRWVGGMELENGG